MLVRKTGNSRNWELVSKWCFHRGTLTNQFFKLPLLIVQNVIVLKNKRHLKTAIGLYVVSNVCYFSTNWVNVASIPMYRPLIKKLLCYLRCKLVYHLTDLKIHILVSTLLNDPDGNCDRCHLSFPLAFVVHNFQSSLRVCLSSKVSNVLFFVLK